MLAGELRAYLEAGGYAIVDAPATSDATRPAWRFSKASGVQIDGRRLVPSRVPPGEIAVTSTNQLADRIIGEFTDGVDGTGIGPDRRAQDRSCFVMSLGEERAFER
jgi:hypothetical protein